MATIIIPTPLRKFTSNQSTFQTESESVGDSIQQLIGTYPDIGAHLLDDQGKIRSFINIFVGDDDIRGLEREATPVRGETVISIVPAIAGGLQ